MAEATVLVKAMELVKAEEPRATKEAVVRLRGVVAWAVANTTVGW